MNLEGWQLAVDCWELAVAVDSFKGDECASPCTKGLGADLWVGCRDQEMTGRDFYHHCPLVMRINNVMEHNVVLYCAVQFYTSCYATLASHCQC